MHVDDVIDKTILEMLEALEPGKSISPMDAAKRVEPEAWNPLLARVKRRAMALARDGRIVIIRKGKPVPDLGAVKGVIRLRLP